MREIKFRAWDKVCNEMFYNSDLSNGDMIVMCLDGEIQLSAYDTYKPSDFELMQYTGLKDKNGKEIYENDIIKAKLFYDDEEQALEYIYKVGFMNGYFYGCDGNTETILDFIDEIEVLGNEFETPDLLEGDVK